MGTGYTRNDTVNNIADGNVINASDLDGEFDAVEAAFSSSTGHTHDGTSAEGAPVTLMGPAQDFVVTATEARPKTDNTLDLGTSTLEFKDAFFDGTVKTDTLTVDENATVTGNLTVNGNTTLGNAATDTVTITADVASDLIPSVDGSFDLGASGAEWQDLFIDGTANIDSLVADTADINGGTADNVVIGGSTPAAGTFTTLTANGNVVLGDAATDTVTVTADVASDLIPSADGTYDLGASGSEWQDLFIDGTANIDSLVADTADINGGTIDGVTIGGASAGAGTFTTLNTTGAVVFNDAGANVDFRVEGDTNANLLFVDASTDAVGIGTSGPSFGSTRLMVNAGVTVTNNGADLPTFQLYNATNGTNLKTWRFVGDAAGGLSIETVNDAYTLASARVTINSSGNVGIGTSSPSYKLSVAGNSATSSNILLTHNTDSTGAYSRIRFQFAEGNTSIASEIRNIQRVAGASGSNLAFFTENNSGTLVETARIDSSGNVGIGTSTPQSKLAVSNGGAAGLEFFANYPGGGVGTYIQSYNRSGSAYVDTAYDASRHAFLISGTERMRIDSSGNVLIGTTTATNGLTVAVGFDLQARGTIKGSQNVGTLRRLKWNTHGPLLNLSATQQTTSSLLSTIV
jgi:hypothetical protein